MSAGPVFDNDLVRRLPLPLAQLYRRAHNSRTPQERHLAAYSLWEAALRLLSSVAVVQCAALADRDEEVQGWLAALAHAPGRRWQAARLLVPLLARRGDPYFAKAQSLLFGSLLAVLPAVMALQAALGEHEEILDITHTGARAPLEGLFTALIAYRNRELGHGVDWRRSPEEYARMGSLLLDAAADILARLDVLAGRRLVYLMNLRASADVAPLLDRFELIGEVPVRIEPVRLEPGATGYPPRPDRLYLMPPPDAPPSPGPLSVPGLLPFDPLVHYDPETGEVFFLHRGRGDRPPEYTCYTTARFTSRRDPDIESLPLLGPVLDIQPQRKPAPEPPAAPRGPRKTFVLDTAWEEPPAAPRGPRPEATAEAAKVAENIACKSEVRRPRKAADTAEADPALGAMPGGAEPASAEPPTGEPATRDPAGAAPARRRLGEFEVLREIGRGGLCALYHGWQPMLGRPVVLKCLPRTAGELGGDKQFLREMRLLGRVRHPSLVQIYGSGMTDDCLYYALEMIEGATLDSLLRRLEEPGRGPAGLDLRTWHQALAEAAGVFPPSNLDAMAGRPAFARIAEVVRQIAGAAHALHQAGVIHRDIKPANIMLTADSARAVLGDLGLAMEGVDEGALTWERGFVGTPGYVSPEQIQGDQNRLDGRSDVYSLGVVLWELLTLRPMRTGESLADVLQRALYEDPEPPRRLNPRVPPALEAICLRCLRRNRDERYATAQELADDLERFLAGEPVAARPRRLLERVTGWLSRPPRLADVAAVMPAAPHRPPVPRVEDEPAPAPRPAPEPRTGPRPAPTQPTASTAVSAPDQAFSSQTVVTLYPVPIAITYRRFCQETHPRSRLEALFFVLEASVRYLLTLGVSDLFHSLAESGGDPAAALAHADFEFLRRPRPMLLGRWIGALREIARALAAVPPGDRFIAELPEVCRPGGTLDADLLAWLVARRNDCAHADGSIRLPDEKCREVLREYRPRLEEVLREIRFVCRYPLGFVTPFAGLSAALGEHYYHLHSCMGAWVGATSRALDLKTPAELRAEFPFVAAPDGKRLLYLWPLLLQRRSEYTGRRTLFVFQEIPDHRRPFLTQVRAAAVDVPETWSADLHPQPAASHAWLLARLRELPPAPAVPAELRLAEKLLPARGGRLVGQEVGSNRLLSVVAVGGFGTIYAAEATDGERVAVKVIESRPTALQLARFSQEIAKLRQAADHPRVIRLFEHGDVDVDNRICPWYSMEFALGGDLRSRIDRRRAAAKDRPPWDDPEARAEVCAEFTAVAEAVAHLHRLRIVHRDIKPGNVLIMGDGSLRLSDFGLVKNLQPTEETLRHGPHSSTGEGAGTPGYMAPEQARGEDAREPADVYALGILLAELALGERPKAELPPAGPDGRTGAGSTLRKCPSLARLPFGLRDLIVRCTDMDPERRPEDAGAVLREFAGLACESPRP